MSGTKEHILRVALKLFLQKSFKEVTMKEIVEKTGMSKGAFYHYFESKEKLFFEIFDHFFLSVINFDFDNLSKESLYQYYHDCTNKLNTLRFKFFDHDEKTSEGFFNINFFSMIFDALKLFPEFRKKMEDFHKKELDAWTTAVRQARKSCEIKSTMSDEQIAMIFIYTSDGLAMNLTLGGNMENLRKELKLQWDKFYESLKA